MYGGAKGSAIPASARASQVPIPSASRWRG